MSVHKDASPQKKKYFQTVNKAHGTVLPTCKLNGIAIAHEAQPSNSAKSAVLGVKQRQDAKVPVQLFCAFCYRWNFFHTKSGGQDKQFPPLLLTHQAVSTDKTNTVVAVSTVSHALSLSLSLSGTKQYGLGVLPVVCMGLNEHEH